MKKVIKINSKNTKKKRKYYMKCQSCNTHKKDTCLRIDPYAQDISNVEIWIKLCDECAHQRAQDI